MHVKKGDNVMVIAGREKGKQGKIIQVITDTGRVVIEGLMMRRRHARPRKQGEKGQILLMPSPIDASNVMLVCSKCGKAARIGRKLLPDGAKVRVCKKCKETI